MKREGERERERFRLQMIWETVVRGFRNMCERRKETSTSERWCDHVAYLSIDVDMSSNRGPEVRLSQ